MHQGSTADVEWGGGRGDRALSPRRWEPPVGSPASSIAPPATPRGHLTILALPHCLTASFADGLNFLAFIHPIYAGYYAGSHVKAVALLPS